MAGVTTMDTAKTAALEASEKTIGAGRQLWLAGLGLVAFALRLGGSAFNALVEQGKGVDRRRHERQYAQGELPRDRSFYFRGPEGKLNLRASSLHTFLCLAEGVDVDTWLHHLRRGDYSKWVRDAIEDPELAEELASVEGKREASSDESRTLVRQMIERRYPAAA